MLSRAREIFNKRLLKGFKFGDALLFREKAGVLDTEPVWVIFEDEYMYDSSYLIGVFWRYATEHRANKHMIG